MTELEKLFGAIGLGLIMMFIPYFLQVVKKLFKWQDNVMLGISLLAVYFLVDLYYIATAIEANSNPTIPQVIFIIIGMIIYPLLVWFGTQGIYTKYMSSSSNDRL